MCRRVWLSSFFVNSYFSPSCAFVGSPPLCVCVCVLPLQSHARLCTEAAEGGDLCCWCTTCLVLNVFRERVSLSRRTLFPFPLARESRTRRHGKAPPPHTHTHTGTRTAIGGTHTVLSVAHSRSTFFFRSISRLPSWLWALTLCLSLSTAISAAPRLLLISFPLPYTQAPPATSCRCGLLSL